MVNMAVSEKTLKTIELGGGVVSAVVSGALALAGVAIIAWSIRNKNEVGVIFGAIFAANGEVVLPSLRQAATSWRELQQLRRK